METIEENRSNRKSHFLQSNLMPTKDEMMKFAETIENLVCRTDYNYIEAIVEHCKSTGLEIEVAAKLVNPTLRLKLENDALNFNLLKEKKTRLPL